MNFVESLKLKQDLVNNNLEKLMQISDAPKKIVEAMKYSLFAGGKRIRPVLSIAVCEALGGNAMELLDLACCIEMIHTYSLIHDDLPAMDNDDFRRGKPTNHKVYGEAIAILAGDALLNYAFEIALNAIKKNNYHKKYTDALIEISKSSGITGMIGGQVIDITSVGNEIDENLLFGMHYKKTGKLIEASCAIGAIIADRYEMLDNVKNYSYNLGIAFQIVDDILDVTGDKEKLGKSIGKDLKDNKPTFVTIFGLEKAKMLANKFSKDAADIALKIDESKFLYELTNYLLTRES
ncbi:Farnesyl diphosphate synthase [Caloramator mitchellensis]|uniref:Farnesyl diphosphate synthase n=1 Tax=Caloramator mitchellensis TaxID=908809 RepID=A0A0R3JTJ7_CALMK|nr:farnesyl diphosphate synthase [Caloramator mitchellensis]KRQ86827.1 Farnesyl diphosphate synthase [Caloramator mitchellensis]